jgi:radical SAM superfamily enzyme YgiQ (UPF0313 family)
METQISILLINPWITDFAAYNLWSEPLGLFYIAAFLQRAEAKICYINCLKSIYKKTPKIKENGCSKYLRKKTEKPECLHFVPRNYAQYGISEDEFLERLKTAPPPDVVLVTSFMTYWYPGVIKTIKLVKEYFAKKVPVILGGIYTQLCKDHAKIYSGADIIFAESNPQKLFPLIERITGKVFKSLPCSFSFSDFPFPLHELHRGMNFFSVLTRRGCPYSCSYCASGILSDDFTQRNRDSIVQELLHYTDVLQTKNIAFYDDALLVDSKNHIIPLLEEVEKKCPDLTFHLPNGIHAGLITKRVAELLFHTGFRTIRIGFETANREMQLKTGRKITNMHYIRSVQYLREAGFPRKSIGTYVMAGLPGQKSKDVEESIDFVYKAGGNPHLSYFSPIPGTKIWPEAVRRSIFSIEKEPLLQNNSVFILGQRSFSETIIEELKGRALELRRD